jgi:predicted RNase H-like HicB family nuclease
MANKLAREIRDKSDEGATMKGTGGQATATARSRERTFPVVIESDADGYFVSCPVLQGCYSQGDTYEKAVENIKDAIRLHVEDRLANGEEVPEKVSVSLSTVEVTI